MSKSSASKIGTKSIWWPRYQAKVSRNNPTYWMNLKSRKRYNNSSCIDLPCSQRAITKSKAGTTFCWQKKCAKIQSVDHLYSSWSNKEQAWKRSTQNCPKQCKSRSTLSRNLRFYVNRQLGPTRQCLCECWSFQLLSITKVRSSRASFWLSIKPLGITLWKWFHRYRWKMNQQRLTAPGRTLCFWWITSTSLTRRRS